MRLSGTGAGVAVLALYAPLALRDMIQAFKRSTDASGGGRNRGRVGSRGARAGGDQSPHSATTPAALIIGPHFS
jgi:hypothetical protein